jgi:hypothetical protein
VVVGCIFKCRILAHFVRSFLSNWAYPKPLFASQTGFFIFFARPNKFGPSLKIKKAPHFCEAL